MDFRGLVAVVVFFSARVSILFAINDDVPMFTCDSWTAANSIGSFDALQTLPYSISVNPGCSIIVIQGTETFKGFLIKAFNERNETVGKFIKNNERAKLICENQAATNVEEGLNVSQIGLRWDSNGFIGTVYFLATVARNLSDYWNITSSTCNTITTTTEKETITTTTTSTSNTSNSNTTSASTSTTTSSSASPSLITSPLSECNGCNTVTATTTIPSVIPSSVTECIGCNATTTTKTSNEGTPPLNPLQDIKPQQSCPANVKCFQCPDNNCVITWMNGSKDYVDFKMSGYVRSDNRYLAMAFSYDQNMGNDSVVLCWKEGDKYLAEVWYTKQYAILKTPDPLESLNPNKTSGSYEDKWMSCKFSKKIERGGNSSNEVYYLNESTYNILFATGMMSPGGPLEHERKTFSTAKFNFTDFTLESSALPKVINQCPVNSGCFQCPDGKCTISWNKKSVDYQSFEITAPVVDETSYLAMALSKDDKMGDDSITVCYKLNNSFVARMWYSEGRSVRNVLNPLESLDPTSFDGTYGSGMMSCRFSKQIKRPQGSDSSVYYPSDQLYYLFFATGPMNGEIPQKHVYRALSTSALDLTELLTSTADESSSNSLIKAHGILMVIAWLMMASVSILLPRYFKSAWPDKKILDKPIWFPIHLTLMVFVFLLTAIAFIIIFCEVRGYVGDDNSATTRAHAPIGIIIMILVVLNPLMALIRCNPDHKHRWVFNYFHACVGEFALVLAVINIFLSFFMPQANIGFWVVWVMVALVCWHALIELLLIMHKRYVKSKSFRIPGDTLSSEIKLHDFTSTSSNLSYFQTFLLFAQWTGVTGLAIAVCVGIGIA